MQCLAYGTCNAAHNLYMFVEDAPTTDLYTLSLHDALPICSCRRSRWRMLGSGSNARRCATVHPTGLNKTSMRRDRKSTRLNSSHVSISYAVFCLKKKNTAQNTHWSVEHAETTQLTMFAHIH